MRHARVSELLERYDVAAMYSIDRMHLHRLMEGQRQRFVATHPKSHEMFRRAAGSLHGGVPMNWMTKWPGPFPVFVAEASGAHFTDLDGHHYVDFCLGDTGAMTGHSSEVAMEALFAQAKHGLT